MFGWNCLSLPYFLLPILGNVLFVKVSVLGIVWLIFFALMPDDWMD